MSDWIMDLLFRSDVTMIKGFAKEEREKTRHDLEMSEKC